MKTTLSLLLASLLVPACAHVPHATDSARDVAPMELASGNADRRNPAAVVQRDYEQWAYYHLGEIRAICAGTTSETCAIKKYLKQIDDECARIEHACDGADKLLDDLFPGTRHKNFANYIVYFDQNHTPGTFHDQRHRPVLMWNASNTRYLRGVSEVYLLIFSEYKFCINAQATTIFRSEPNPLLPLLKLLGKDTGIGETQVGLKAQKTADFMWFPLSGDPEDPVMWLAIGNVTTNINTTDWVTVMFKQRIAKSEKAAEAMPEECVADPLQANRPYFTESVLAHNVFFSDSRASRGGLAVAFGATFPRGKLASLGVANPTFDGFVLAKYYIQMPILSSDPNTAPGLLQYRKRSIGIGIGTNIGVGSASSLSQVIGVISVGHLFLRSNVGVLAGMSYFLPPKPATTDPINPALTKRHVRPFVGIEYSF